MQSLPHIRRVAELGALSAVHRMLQVPITQVEVTATGLFQVKPSLPGSEDFEHIYRDDTDAQWPRHLRVLTPAKVVEFSLAQWFAEIVWAVASEYGILLGLSIKTKRENISEQLRSEMEAFDLSLGDTADWPSSESL